MLASKQEGLDVESQANLSYAINEAAAAKVETIKSQVSAACKSKYIDGLLNGRFLWSGKDIQRAEAEGRLKGSVAEYEAKRKMAKISLNDAAQKAGCSVALVADPARGGRASAALFAGNSKIFLAWIDA